MIMGYKLAILGAGSTFTPEFFSLLLEQGISLEIEQATLMDPNPERVAFMADVVQRLLKNARSPIRLLETTDRREALQGADFVLLQMRVGGLAARVRDERLPLDHNLVGNELVGAGGFMCGLRNVTAALEIARDIEQIAPQAWLFNITDPVGMVTEAIQRHTSVQVIGFCSIPASTLLELAEIVDTSPQYLRLDYFGLNHLSWVRSATIGGREVLKPLIAAAVDLNALLYRRGLVDPMVDPEWLHTLGMLPRPYNRYYDYPDRALWHERRNRRTPGEEDMLADKKLENMYITTGYTPSARRILVHKGGADYYPDILKVMDALVNDTEAELIANVRNDGAIPDLPPQAVVEIPVIVRRDGVHPQATGPLPLIVRGVVQAVKAYEELTIEAARTGSRPLAIAALTANPLVKSVHKARDFFYHALPNERSFLPQFLGPPPD
jgi:6-phospho-beta-glucosidase